MLLPDILSIVKQFRLPPHWGLFSPTFHYTAVTAPDAFSGAVVFRLTDGTEKNLCLRGSASPARASLPTATIHDYLRIARSAGLDWIPGVYGTHAGASDVHAHDRTWVLLDWMPGKSGSQWFEQDAGKVAVHLRFRSQSLHGLARLHACWRTLGQVEGISPTILRRWQTLELWQDRLRRTTSVSWDGLSPTIRWIATRIWDRVHLPYFQEACQRLYFWAHRPLPLQPIHGDAWIAHFLFNSQGQLCGLIDFESMKVDHVLIDLARLVHSVLSRDSLRYGFTYVVEHAVADYPSGFEISTDERRLFEDLLRSATLAGLCNWLERLLIERRPVSDEAAAVRRIETLLAQLP